MGQDGDRVISKHPPERLRIDREKSGVALFALAKVVRELLSAQPLQVQGNSDPVGRTAAEVTMQLHRGLPTILSARSIDATHIVSMLSISQQVQWEAVYGS